VKKKASIQSRIAIFLLAVFALSITPKVVFHEVLAGHTDSLLCQDKDKTSPHFHQPVFHCSFDDLVVASPYLTTGIQTVPERPSFFTRTVFGFFSSTASTPFLHCESRGPPLM
jgi:hypothetical protein